MNFIEWMFLVYLISITGADIVDNNKTVMYQRAGIAIVYMFIYGIYSVINWIKI